MFRLPSPDQPSFFLFFFLEKKQRIKKFPDSLLAFFNSSNYILKLLRHISPPLKTSSRTFCSGKISVQNFGAGDAMIQAQALWIFYHFRVLSFRFVFLFFSSLLFSSLLFSSLLFSSLLFSSLLFSSLLFSSLLFSSLLFSSLLFSSLLFSSLLFSSLLFSSLLFSSLLFSSLLFSSLLFSSLLFSSLLFFSFLFCLPFLFARRPTDRPTFTRERAMGKETFYGESLIRALLA